MSYWQNYKKFFVSFQKSMYGPAATAENDLAYHYLPKLDVPAYDVLRAFELMHKGKMNGYICQGFNPLHVLPQSREDPGGAVKLKFLVSMDPLQTETAQLLGGPRRATTWPIRRRSRPRLRAADAPALPRTRARSSTPGAGCNGIGPEARLRARPSPTSGSWPAPSADEGALPEGRRGVPRSDPQSALALQGCG